MAGASVPGLATKASNSLPVRALKFGVRRVGWFLTGAARDAWETLRGTRDPLVPPRRRIFVGEGDFRSTGDEFRNLFVDLGGLKPEDDVLDVGSGIGRIAVGLTGFLQGRYEGFDIVAKGIEWSQREITPRHPNFRFQRADVFNKRYNRGGRWSASEYRFPYEDKSFDFAILTSVFTHLLPTDAEHYAREVGRVLRPGGTCFATFFLLDDRTLAAIEAGQTTPAFHIEADGYRTMRKADPEAAVAHPVADVARWFDTAGLTTRTIHPGSWSGGADHTSYQDIVVALR
jgi:SAM-dependent methyltransferase